MVIYFSGTGNSRYVAEAVADRLADKVISANAVIKEGKKVCFVSHRPLVFVFPIYLSTMAEVFADFIKKSGFRGEEKAYFIGTCASSIGAAPNRCAKLCEEKHLTFMGTARIQMPQNYVALFTMTAEDECRRRQEQALAEADRICSFIKKGEKIETKLASKAEATAVALVEKMYNGPFTGTKKFYATDACIGCGLCEKNCPMNRITMHEGKPQWNGSCIHCMACINRCPKKAIEYGKNTVGKTRYVCRKYK